MPPDTLAEGFRVIDTGKNELCEVGNMSDRHLIHSPRVAYSRCHILLLSCGARHRV